jgi:hypothetical protein
MRPRIMYIEDKFGGLSGPGRIGRVRFSQTGFGHLVMRQDLQLGVFGAIFQIDHAPTQPQRTF